MLQTYIKMAPVTPKGKYQIAQQRINGSYHVICECALEHAADKILNALRNDEFSGRLLSVVKEAAE
jgi:hypothetical protein